MQVTLCQMVVDKNLAKRERRAKIPRRLHPLVTCEGGTVVLEHAGTESRRRSQSKSKILTLCSEFQCSITASPLHLRIM